MQKCQPDLWTMQKMRELNVIFEQSFYSDQIIERLSLSYTYIEISCINFHLCQIIVFWKLWKSQFKFSRVKISVLKRNFFFLLRWKINLDIMPTFVQRIEEKNLSFQIFLYRVQRLSLEKRKNIHFVVSRILEIFEYVWISETTDALLKYLCLWICKPKKYFLLKIKCITNHQWNVRTHLHFFFRQNSVHPNFGLVNLGLVKFSVQ